MLQWWDDIPCHDMATVRWESVVCVVAPSKDCLDRCGLRGPLDVKDGSVGDVERRTPAESM
jgi:hypothetical protein